MGTQLPETFVLLRSCLEYAGYGLHLNANPSLGQTWLKRHDDAAALRAMKKAFLGVEVEQTILATDKELARIYGELYERTIDFGGHPNLRGVLSNMMWNEGNEKRELQQIYLHANETTVLHALKTTAQVGMCSLHLFQHVFPERFSLLQIRDRLTQLRAGPPRL
jgi:hypothetical protein